MNSFEKRLKNKIFDNVPDLSSITPGVMMEVWERGRKRGTVLVGETYTYYDLASLTKIIFTSAAALHYFSDHRRELRRPAREKLSWLKLGLTPFELMTHTAGLEWWLPIYKRLHGPFDPVLRWAQLEGELAKIKRHKRKHAVYSDPDLWMMGAFLREACGFELHDLWEETADRVRIQNIFFHPKNKPRFKRSLYAPTERCPWRQKTMRGEVHDENCWALGGVSSHAGLFGTLDGVAEWGRELRRAVRGESPRFGDPGLVKYFTARRVPRKIGDWGLCFMKPSRPHASCGRYFGVDSFGHTGFTGTSFWLDPKRDLFIVILSNRVHPTRENRTFLKLRPLLHDLAVESL